MWTLDSLFVLNDERGPESEIIDYQLLSDVSCNVSDSVIRMFQLAFVREIILKEVHY